VSSTLPSIDRTLGAREHDQVDERAMRTVMDAFNQAWNDHDLAVALALITEDCVFDATSPAPDGVRAVGRDAVAAAWEPIFADPRSHFEAEESFVAGDRFVQLWRFDWGDGHVRGVDVLRLRDGLVSEKLSYVKG
jgi:hypothetical protein